MGEAHIVFVHYTKKKTNANSSKAHRVHTSRSYIIRKVLEDTEEQKKNVNSLTCVYSPVTIVCPILFFPIIITNIKLTTTMMMMVYQYGKL